MAIRVWGFEWFGLVIGNEWFMMGLQVFQELGMWSLGFGGGEGGSRLRVIVEYNCSDWVLLRFRLIFKGLSSVVSVRGLDGWRDGVRLGR